MSLSKAEAERLFNLGFKRPEFTDEVYPQDIFDYQNSTWIVGGRLLPSGTPLCDEKIYKEGTWIPSLADLISWLEESDCTFTMSYGGLGYKIEVTDGNKKKYKGKGGTLEFALLKVILQVLEQYGGSPVAKNYQVIEAEFIEKKDL
ncbi:MULTISPECIES: hypothetical protein [Brevibacillus]|jgi:hypothetical protein|uniref:hypothetical protein n=1 Tax=Brevibacillus TaxID=55080 RepID=UPI00156B4B7F|nr:MULTISPECIES: hypothetical protein [Brevibacillus]MDH6353515.1 hypothetical protein [Brevibacillus sp. 1238]MDR5000190.1 hypothetical protein [Brevibacillus parabrevis]UED70147.1 hypothetical protein HP435_05825 [Brevibacillus sp. HD3.3A]